MRYSPSSILFGLPMAAAVYRGSLGWIDVVVAVMGIAALAVAADSFAPRSAWRTPHELSDE